MSWHRKAPDSMPPYLTPTQIAGDITFTLSAQVDEAFRKSLSMPTAPDKPTPATETSWEQSVGSVTGYRLFRVDDRGRLRPAMTSAPYAWRPGENIASCYQYAPSRALSMSMPPMVPNEAHRAPAEGCDCGFYARTVFDPYFWNAAFDDFGSASLVSGRPSPPAILGVIEGYGRTEVGTKGFRCEKAKVLALYVPGRKRKLVEATRLLYPDVQFLDTRAEVFERWPQFTRTEVAQRDIGPDFWKVRQYE